MNKHAISASLLAAAFSLSLASQVVADEPASPKPGAAEKAPSKAKARLKKRKLAALYQCPMHPEVTSDKPGKCPKCHMDLEKAGKK